MLAVAVTGVKTPGMLLLLDIAQGEEGREFPNSHLNPLNKPPRTHPPHRLVYCSARECCCFLGLHVSGCDCIALGGVVQAKTQVCKLGTEAGVHDRLA